MTLPYSASIATFMGNGIATKFPFSFKVWDKSQLQLSVVRPDGVLLDIPFTAQLTETGGTVTALYEGKPLLPGWKLSIIRDMPFAQGVDLVSGTRFDPQVLEDALDAATAERQQLRETLERAVVVPPGSEEPPEILADLIFEARDTALNSAVDAKASKESAAGSAAAAQESVAGAKAGITAAKERAMAEITTLADTRTSQLSTLAAEGTASFINLSNARTEQFTALAELKTASINALGNNITIVAEASVARIADEGNTQWARLNAVADTSVNTILEKGEEQADNLTVLGTDFVKQARDAALTSIQESARAEAAAQRAVDMTGVGLASKTNFGLTRVGSGLEVVDGVISVSIRRLLTLPVLDFVAQGAIGHSYTLSMSSSTSLEGAAIDYFTVFMDGAAAMRLPAENGSASCEVLVTGLDGATGTIVVQATDTAKNESDEKTITYIKREVSLRAPRVIQPAPDAVNVALSPTVIVQAFDISGILTQPTATQIRVARDAEFTDIVYDTGTIAYTTEHTLIDTLAETSPFYIQARHQGGIFGWSAYGQITRFTTVPKTVLAPLVLAPPNASVGQSVEPTFVLSQMQSTGIVDTPVATHLQVSAEVDFATLIFDTTENGAYATSIKCLSLRPATVYYVRARHKGLSLGWSAWSLLSSFETLQAFVHAPLFSAPEEDSTTTTLTPILELSAFANTGPPDSPQGRQIQISLSGLFTPLLVDTGLNGVYTQSYTCPSLPLNTRVFCRARDTGTLWGQSPWSDILSFTTVNAAVNTPTVDFSDAAEAETGITKSLEPVFLFSEFSHSGPRDTPAATRCQIARDVDFLQIVYDSGETGRYATSICCAKPGEVSGGLEYPAPLDSNSQYYIRVRHKGTLWGWSDWSTGRLGESGFRTVHVYTHVPSVLAPAEGIVTTTLRPEFRFSDFANAGPKDTPSNTHFQVSARADFTTKLIDTTDVGGYVTKFLPQSLLPMNTSLYARVRHRGTFWGWSEWSAVRSFKTLTASVNKVDVSLPAAGSSLLQVDVSLACPPISGVGEIGALVATQWLVTNLEGASLFDSGWDSKNLLTKRIPSLPVGPAKIFVRHKSALGLVGSYGTGVKVTFTSTLGQVFEVLDSGIWIPPAGVSAEKVNMGVGIHDKNFFTVGEWVYVDGVKHLNPLAGKNIRPVVKSHNGRILFHTLESGTLRGAPGKLYFLHRDLSYEELGVSLSQQSQYSLAPLGYVDEDNMLFVTADGVVSVNLPTSNMHLVTAEMPPGYAEYYCIYEHPYVYFFSSYGYGAEWNILIGIATDLPELVPEGSTPKYIYIYEKTDRKSLYAYPHGKRLKERIKVSFGADKVDFNMLLKGNSAFSGRIAYVNGRTYVTSANSLDSKIINYVSNDGLNFTKCYTAPSTAKAKYIYMGCNNNMFISAVANYNDTPLLHLTSVEM